MENIINEQRRLSDRRSSDNAFSWVRQTQDSDVYHWSSNSFKRYWYARVGAAIIRQRARIGMAAASRDRKHIERTTGLGSYAP